MSIADLVGFVLPGLLVGTLAGAAMKDARAAVGGGVLGAAVGWMVYAVIRFSYWFN